METVELGDVRIHVVTAWPGLPGESDRVARELSRLDPALILADLDTEDALALQRVAAEPRPRFAPTFIDALFEEELARRFTATGDTPAEHPFLGAARVARNRKAGFLPLRPHATPPGFFARRRARKAVAAIAPGKPEDFVPAYARALAREAAWDPVEDARAAQPRLRRALDDGRGPLVALVQAHRAPALLKQIRETRSVRA